MLARAAVHIHSEWSYDANWSLHKIARLFRCMNYRIILMTEHDISFDDNRWESYRKACEKLSTDDLLIIPGIEYSDPTNTIHILVWGNLPFLGKYQQTEDILTRVKGLDGLTVLAHPSSRKAHMLFKPERFELLLGIEQWNRKSDGIAPSNEATLLINKYKLVPFYGLDFHQINQFFPLAMRIEIDGNVTPDIVISALKNRQCYPEIVGIPPKWSIKISQSNSLVRLERLRRLIRQILKHKKKARDKSSTYYTGII